MDDAWIEFGQLGKNLLKPRTSKFINDSNFDKYTTISFSGRVNGFSHILAQMTNTCQEIKYLQVI